MLNMIIEWTVQIVFMVLTILGAIFIPMTIFLGHPIITLAIVLPILMLLFRWMLKTAKGELG